MPLLPVALSLHHAKIWSLEAWSPEADSNEACATTRELPLPPPEFPRMQIYRKDECILYSPFHFVNAFHFILYSPDVPYLGVCHFQSLKVALINAPPSSVLI